MTTNALWWIINIILLLLAGGFGLYFGGKKWIPKWAEEGKFFATVKPGRVIAIGMAGNVKAFYSNVTGVHYNRTTGKKMKGPDHEIVNSWLWQEYGAIFIGFEKVMKYPFKKRIMEGNVIKTIDTMADSLHEKNRFVVVTVDAETLDKVAVTLTVELKVRLVNAKLSLECSNWVTAAETLANNAFVMYILGKHIHELSKENLEDNGELYRYMRDTLSNDTGNKGLPSDVGQELEGWSVQTFVITSKKYQAALESGTIEKANAEGKLEAAKGDAAAAKEAADAKFYVAQKEALAIKEIGDARNEVLKKMAEVLSQEQAGKLAEVQATATASENSARAIADAVKSSAGLKAVSFGAGSTSVLINEQDGSEQKKKKKGEEE